MTDDLVRRLAVAGLVCALTLTGACHHRAAPAPVAPAGPSLYERLSGHDAVALVVGDFVSRVGADARISAFFRGVDLDELKRLLGEQICQAAGGPCRYSGRPMRVAHAGLHIRDADFNALVEDLTAALGRYNVPAREQRELLTALGGMRRDIVGR